MAGLPTKNPGSRISRQTVRERVGVAWEGSVESASGMLEG